MAAMAQMICFDKDGRQVGASPGVFLPEYLDWLPIEAKVFWYVTRGYGEPRATHMLFISQGEQRLITLTTPLQHMTHSELTEKNNGLEQQVIDYCARQGISRTPRNQ